MFKNLRKGSSLENTARSHPSPTHNRDSNSSSQSNAFAYSSSTTDLRPPSQQRHPGAHHIPMENIHSDINMVDMTSNELKHDPLPPAVDFSNVHPTARYQFRALARRAVSFHRRQRFSNICCLVLWPIILVLLCFVFSIVMNSGKSHVMGMVQFCSNEANPETSVEFTLDSPVVGPAAWYPSAFSGRTYAKPCVRWFGDSYPSKAPYENATAAARSQPDR